MSSIISRRKAKYFLGATKQVVDDLAAQIYLKSRELDQPPNLSITLAFCKEVAEDMICSDPNSINVWDAVPVVRRSLNLEYTFRWNPSECQAIIDVIDLDYAKLQPKKS